MYVPYAHNISNSTIDDKKSLLRFTWEYPFRKISLLRYSSVYDILLLTGQVMLILLHVFDDQDSTF